MGSPKINFQSRFHTGCLKGSPWQDSTYGLRNEFSSDNIWPIFSPKNNKKNHWNRNSGPFWWFSDQNMSQILSKFNSETMFGILSSMRTFWTLNEKTGLNICFLTSHSIVKILSFVRERKRQFSWEKNDIDLLFASHGTGLAPVTSKKLSSVKNKTPYCHILRRVYIEH